MFIFIDDERMPADVTWVKLPKPKEWHVCRSYKGFVKLLESCKEAPMFISFDHDLGLPKDGSDEKTGVHCAKALINICVDNHWKLPGVQVHSMNPVGKKNIIDVLDNGEKWVKISSSPGIKPCYDEAERKK